MATDCPDRFSSRRLCLYAGEAHGKKNLFIPGDGIVFVCPELVTHYMNAHGYAPSAEFCLAALACPPMRSMEYLRSLLSARSRGSGAS